MYRRSVSLHYKLFTFTERSGWNIPFFKPVTGSSRQKQVSEEAGGTADTQVTKL
jgi:hypothetical protein